MMYGSDLRCSSIEIVKSDVGKKIGCGYRSSIIRVETYVLQYRFVEPGMTEST